MKQSLCFSIRHVQQQTFASSLLIRAQKRGKGTLSFGAACSRRFTNLIVEQHRPQLPIVLGSVSVGAGTRSLATQVSTSEQSVKDLLRQADRIIHSEYANKDDVEIDAESLLMSTSTPEILSNHLEKEQSPETKSLHRAFLHLTAKSLAHSSPMAIQLAQRAHQFALCFHLPLYKQILVNAATHSRVPAQVMLEMAAYACHSLHVTLESPFFSAALRILVQRNLLRDALKVLVDMKNCYDIHDIPDEVAIFILSTMRDNVQECDEKDASALFIVVLSMMDEPEVLDEEKPLIEQISDVLDRFDDDDDDDYDYTYDDDMVDNLMDMFEEGGIDLHTVMSNMRQDDDQTSRYAFAMSPKQYHPQVIKNTIYLRDAATWKLPDVTEQMVQLSEGRELLYSQFYEEEVMEKMMKDETD